MYNILLVEDEPSVLKNLKMKIESSGVHSFQIIETAYTAEEAWKKLKSLSVDVFISDIRMPGLGGLWLFEQVRCSFPDMICIALSAYCEFEYLQQCIRIGIEDYFLKPVSLEQVKEKLLSLEKLLRKKKEEGIEYQHSWSLDNTDLCNKIDKYIKIHYSEKISLKQMADLIGYSSQYICEVYKKKRRITLGDAIAQYRLTRACSLIRQNPELSFSKIAELVGYTDYRYFSRVFKKQFGMTLSEFKEKED